MKEVNHSKIKETNRKKIIKLLLKKDEITKLDISRELNISITTVTTNINELKINNIVEEVGALESTGGRKALAIKVKENCKYSIGVAVTPKHVKISLANIKRVIIENVRVRHDNNGIENIVELINRNISDLLEKHSINSEELLGIGISIPGTVDSENGIIKYSYLLNVKEFNLRESFKHINVPIYVDNEANLSAYYEFLSRRDTLKNLLYVSITEGVGLGIIINDRIYRGDNNSSGELGHMKICMDGKKCKCGGSGCFEAYASINSLIDNYNEISDSNICDIDSFEEKYNEKDELVETVLDKYIKVLSVGISNLNMLLDPNIIILGGDINNLINNKIDDLKVNIYKDNSFINEKNCTISVSNFKESYLLGAAMTPIEEFLEIK